MIITVYRKEARKSIISGILPSILMGATAIMMFAVWPTFKKEAAEKVFSLQKIEGWSFDVEILYIAYKLNLKVKEIPIRWINSPASKVNPVKDAINMFKDVLWVRQEY